METVADEATLIKEANLSLGAQTTHCCIYYTKDELLFVAASRTAHKHNSTQPRGRQIDSQLARLARTLLPCRITI
jgi:hypothetical protein